MAFAYGKKTQLATFTENFMLQFTVQIFFVQIL